MEDRYFLQQQEVTTRLWEPLKTNIFVSIHIENYRRFRNAPMIAVGIEWLAKRI